jgi:crotonobetainyl-CoA:carnitine CoA-transferase CaiB-like acyl-CoA transferase
MSGSATAAGAFAPALGEHTREVLEEQGFSASDIAALIVA